MSNNKPSFGAGAGKGPGARFNHKKEKIKNPMGTTKRLITYLHNKIGLLVVIFCICILTTLISIIGTKMNGEIVDLFILTGDMKGLTAICKVLGVMYVVNGLCTLIQNRMMIYIAQHTTAEIRSHLFSSIQKLPLKYFDTHSSGDIMSRLTNDVDNINMTLSQNIIQFLSGIINIVGMLVAMLLLSPLLTGVGLLMMPLMFLTSRILIKKTQPFFIKQQKELGKLNGYIEERVSGQKVILLFSKEEETKREFEAINRELTKSAIVAQGVSSFMGPSNNMINNLTYLIVAVTGGLLIISGKGVTVGVLFTFMLYMRNFTRPINEILNIFNTIQSALAGAERVFEVIDEAPEQDLPIARDLESLRGEVKLQDVDFSYIPDKKILIKANITAYPGQTIAIVGPTGAGKTTIINLLTKFYDIDSGNILIDGVNLNEITRKSLRQNISMVLQDTFLFSKSVRENIRYGNLTATNEEVEQAAKMANAHHFIIQLPEGYDTVLSDNGSNISQGQRQLLAIARAVLAKTSILILDEATSSIDTRTEVAIQKAMLRLMEGKTTFVIAHRLSTIKNADNILVLKDGQIIETGKHEALLERQGFYADLYQSQFKNQVGL